MSKISTSSPPQIPILPYTSIVGQSQQKLALELAYISSGIGGVLLSGQRGTGKSTIARAFAHMMYDGSLPVTLPINATEDRVVGGWKIDELMAGKPIKQDGLLMDANDKMLYIDEVNLLDDHIVNIILDVTSTGILTVQRDNRDDPPINISFILIGTMNPSEGSLRPQLLDRFGLMVNVTAETESNLRTAILHTVLKLDNAKSLLKRKQKSPFLEEGYAKDKAYKPKLETAKAKLEEVEIPDSIIQLCVDIAEKFKVEGNRCDYILALASRAYASLQGDSVVEAKHIHNVVQMVVQHRRPEFLQSGQATWTSRDDEIVGSLLQDV